MIENSEELSDQFSNMISERNYLTTYNTLKEDATNPDLPRAYLNFLFFDEDMHLVPEYSHAWQVGAETGTWTQLGMTGDMEVPQNGYVLSYISNEQYMDVYFDNLEITHYRGRLLEEDHYYPHGLLMKKSVAAGNTVKNRYHYEGKEMQDELGLQLYDFHARQYDPQIGRFWGVDPMDQFPSGYTGIGNDPVNLADPSGMKAVGGGDNATANNPGYNESDGLARKRMPDPGLHSWDIYVDGEYMGNMEDAFLQGDQFLGGLNNPDRKKVTPQAAGSDGIPLPELTVVGRNPHWASWINRMESLGYKITNKLAFLYGSGSMWSSTHKTDPLDFYKTAFESRYLPFRPDAVGISIPITANGISGYTGSLNIGWVGDDFGVWMTEGYTFGLPEVGLGGGFFFGEYHGQGKPTLSSYMGYGDSFSLGSFGVGIGYSRGYAKYGDSGPIWQSVYFGVDIKSTTIISPYVPTLNYSPMTYSQGFLFW